MHRPMPPLMDSIVDVIGHAPMVKCRRLLESRRLRGRLLAKRDYLNPRVLKKDRIAREMILEASESGQLKPSQTVVELTSGNTGIGLAIVCRAMGYPFVAVMSKGNTIERARMMKALGAEVVRVEQAPGSPPNQVSDQDLAFVEQKAQELVKERGAFHADQFSLSGNVLAYEQHTGPEIWEQSEGKADVFLGYAGTGGTFAGTSRFLKSKRHAIRCYLVEPATAAVLAGKPATNSSHRIQGGGYNMANLPLLNRSLVTDYLSVMDEEAIEDARLLVSKEGIFAGVSSGGASGERDETAAGSRLRRNDRVRHPRQRAEVSQHGRMWS